MWADLELAGYSKTRSTTAACSALPTRKWRTAARLDPLADRHPPNLASRVQETGRHSGADGAIVTGTPTLPRVPDHTPRRWPRG